MDSVTSKTFYGLPRPTKKTAITVCLILLLVPIFTIWNHNQDSFRMILNDPVTDYLYKNSSNPPPTTQSVTLSTTTTTNASPPAALNVALTNTTITTISSTTITTSVPQSELIPLSQYPPPSQLINITNFQFLINPVICHPEEDIFMLVMVGSNPKNVMVREAIRKTWGNPKIEGYPFKLVFVFGKQTDYLMQKFLEIESKERGDIIQGNFEDSYHNVTARDMMGLRWAWSYCDNANYIIRADDDISVNIFTLKDVVQRMFGGYRPRKDGFLACYAQFVNAPALRTGQYAISRDEYPRNTYDPYCSGWLYILNPKMAYDLDQAGLRVKPFWMNDAYITGALTAAIGAKIHDLHISYTFNYMDMIAMESQNLILPLRFVLGYVGNNVTLIENLHQKYKAVAMRKRQTVTGQQILNRGHVSTIQKKKKHT